MKRGRYDNSDEVDERNIEEMIVNLFDSICEDKDFVRLEEFRNTILNYRDRGGIGENPLCDLKTFLMAGGDVNEKIGGDLPYIVGTLQDEEEETEDIVNILATLIKFGADVNATDKNGVCALALAIEFRFYKCIELLYTAGAKSDKIKTWRDKKFRTALEFIEERIEKFEEELLEYPHEEDVREDLKEEKRLYEFVKKWEKIKNRYAWTGKTIRATQQWRPNGVARSQMEYNQMRDIFRKFGNIKSGYLGGGRSRSRSRSRSSRRSSHRRSSHSRRR